MSAFLNIPGAAEPVLEAAPARGTPQAGPAAEAQATETSEDEAADVMVSYARNRVQEAR